MSSKKMRDINEALDVGTQATEQVYLEQVDKPDRKQTIRIALVIAIIVGILGMAASIAISLVAANQTADLKARQQAVDVSSEQSKALAEKAYAEATEANKILEARGQAPVPVPPPSEDDPTNTIASAAAAKVLAQLEQTNPTANDLGQAVAQYIISNPQGPTAGQISALIAGYFTANPPPSGPQGEPGRPGEPGQPGQSGAPAPPITSEEILAGVTAYCDSHNGCKGDSGPQGVGVQSITVEGNPNSVTGCDLVAILVNPATGNTSEQRTPISSAICAGSGNNDAEPTTTTTPPEDPGGN